MNWCKGFTCHEWEYKSHDSKKVHFSSGRAKSLEALSDENKGLRKIIDEKITAALDRKEKKEPNKFETLSILPNSKKEKDSNINSRASNTSNKDIDSE
eukprot:12057334-Ditylum_brightwellii.AAC.1